MNRKLLVLSILPAIRAAWEIVPRHPRFPATAKTRCPSWATSSPQGLILNIDPVTVRDHRPPPAAGAIKLAGAGGARQASSPPRMKA